MADVFISYSRRDKGRVALLADRLEYEGFSVWWDPNIEPGGEFRDVIESEAKLANAIVPVWSAHSITSQWVAREATLGRERDCLLPVLIDSVNIPAPFADVHAADLREWDGSPEEPEWEEFVVAIKNRVSPSNAGVQRQLKRPRRASDAGWLWIFFGFILLITGGVFWWIVRAMQ